MLDRINARLKEDGLRVRVEARGNRLCLRATLPIKDGTGTKQQRIPLDTSSTEEADTRARELGRQLRDKAFSWETWDLVQTVDYTIADFREAGKALYESKYRTETAWKKKWQPALNKLPPDSVPCSQTVLLRTIERMKPGSAGRRDQGNVIAQIARTLKFDYEELQAAARGYSAASLTPRNIPKDSEIVKLYSAIKLPHWKWMYGMCATYGLRPHEIVECRLTREGNCEIDDDTKTGHHIAWPCNADWVEQFELRKIERPSQGKATVAKVANDYLHERGPLPWPLYNLRHAYAIRVLLKGVPPEIGAQLMGHSPEVHHRTYHRWIQARRITNLRSQFKL